MMLSTQSRAYCSAPLRLLPKRPTHRSVLARAEGQGNFDIDKFVAELPVPVEYAYAGVAWGFTLLTWGTPLNFIGKTVVLLHLLAAATSVARIGAVARPDQTTGETEAAKEFGKGLLTGPFHVNWLGVERFKKK